MKKQCVFAVLSAIFGSFGFGFGQKVSYLTAWTKVPFDHNLFIENIGQFDTVVPSRPVIKFQASLGKVKANFTPSGIVYKYTEYPARKTGPDREEMEKEGEDTEFVKPVQHYLNLTWEGSNPDVQIEVQELQQQYYTYPKGTKDTYKVRVFKKLIYRNIYPGIDIEYGFPGTGKTGLKYTVVVHPGADLSIVKLRYSEVRVSRIDLNGNAVFATEIGELTDHAPVSFYQGGGAVSVSYRLEGQVESFLIKSPIDKSQTLVIDPWTTDPLFAAPYDDVFDVDYDNLGNVYAYGGFDPYQLTKFNAAGVQQWTYNTVFPNSYGLPYYGDFAVDRKSGSSYCVDGAERNGAYADKVSTFGALQAQYTGSPSFLEMWRAVYDPCSGNIVIGGGGTNAPNPQACMLDTNLVTLTPVNSLGVTDFGHDICLISSDPAGGVVYMATTKPLISPDFANDVFSLPLPALTPPGFVTPDGFTFAEVASIPYVGVMVGDANGMNGLAASPNFLYMYDGATLKQASKTTGATGNSIALNTKYFRWGGLDADFCDNVYVGNQTNLQIYNSGLGLVSTIALPDTVYDVVLGANDKIAYVGGQGYVTEITLNNPIPVNITHTVTSTCVACNGTAKSTLLLCNNPPVPAPTYSWSNGQTTQTATGLCAGNYTVTISVGPPCTAPMLFLDSVVIPASTGATLAVTPGQTNVKCNGAATGSATVTPTNGTGPYTYSWTPTALGTSSTATGLAAGTYTVISNDATCLSDTTIFTITQPPVLTVNATTVNAACGSSDGSATATGNGGAGGYSYTWNGPVLGATDNGLAAGNYTVTVTDVNSCTNSAVAIVGNTGGPMVTMGAPSLLKCHGDRTGTVSATAVGGAAPLTYSWAPAGGTGATASGLGAGVYTLTVEDANGCKVLNTVTFPQPAALTLTGTGLSTSCSAICNGQAVVIPAGGTAPIGALWSTAGTGLSVNNLCAGTVSVTLTDANGCQKDTTITVPSPTALVITTSSLSAKCNSNNGSASATATGGTPGPGGYTFSWSNAFTGQVASGVAFEDPNLITGIYTVTVTDNNNCTNSATVNVGNLNGVNASIGNPVPVSCFGTCTGSALAQANGGTGPYIYAWSNAVAAAANPNLCQGSYTVTITDNNSCTSSAVVQITQPPALTVLPPNPAALCAGQNVSVAVSPAGGTPAYTYSWSPGGMTGSTESLQPLSSTVYTVTVTDANACPVVVNIAVTVNTVPAVSFVADTLSGCVPLCVVFKDKSTAVPDQVNTWSWKFGNGDSSALQNPKECFTKAGVYSISLWAETTQGCFSSDTIQNMITVFPIPHAAFTTDPSSATIDNPIFHFMDQSTGENSWLWNFGDTSETALSTIENPTHTYASKGTFCTKLIVKNADGCVDSTTLCVVVGPDFEFFIPNAFTPNGDGLNDTFKGEGIGIVSYEMIIFDRWGNLIFTTYDLNFGWNGTANGGNQICQQDVYVYKVVLTDVFNVYHTYIGDVTLIK